MLMNNEHYPHYLKMRILGDEGHLSNKDSAYYLKKFIGDDTKHIILAHLSEHNNTDELALKTLKETIDVNDLDVEIAHQEIQTELIEV